MHDLALLIGIIIATWLAIILLVISLPILIMYTAAIAWQVHLDYLFELEGIDQQLKYLIKDYPEI